eukprot:IDg22662t1
MSTSSSADSYSSDDGSSDTRRHQSHLQFNADAYCERMEKWSHGPRCCKAMCNSKISARAIHRQADQLSIIHSAPTPAARRQLLRYVVQHTYITCWGDSKRHGKSYKLSSMKREVCRIAWLKLWDVNVKTFEMWASCLPRYDPAPPQHALVDRNEERANAYNAEMNDNLVQFIMDVAREDGHPLPIRVRTSDGGEVDDVDVRLPDVVYLPPQITIRGLHRMYLRRYPEQPVSLGTLHAKLTDMPTIKVSKRERGLCDACFVMRDSVRTLQKQPLLEERVAMWNVHLRDARAMRDQYRECGARAREAWVSGAPDFIMLSFDYARQLGVPSFTDETTKGFWSSKQSLDVNLFGIVNEGSGEYGRRHAYLVPEGMKNGADTVCSMLHHFITDNDLHGAHKLILWSDSCTGQNKNNIVVAFLLMLVHNGVFDEIDWRFLAVGHTKFNPDLFFGMVRTALQRKTVLTIDQLVAVITSISNAEAHEFDASTIRDWHAAQKPFKNLPDIKKTFYFRIMIKKRVSDEVLCVYTCDSPDGNLKEHELVRKKPSVPTMNDIDAIPPVAAPSLTQVRREGLYEKVYKVLRDNERLEPDVDMFWRGVVGDAFPPDASDASARSARKRRRLYSTPPLPPSPLVSPSTTVPTSSTPPQPPASTTTTPSPRTGDTILAATAAATHAMSPEDVEREDAARRALRRGHPSGKRARKKKTLD